MLVGFGLRYIQRGARPRLRWRAILVICALTVAGLAGPPTARGITLPLRCYPNLPLAGGGPGSVELSSDGTAWASGTSEYGALGSPGGNASTPRQVVGLNGLAAISAGQYVTLGLKADGTVWGWGRNDYGQLGDGTTTDRYAPVQVSGLSTVATVAAAHSTLGHSLAAKDDGTVWAWGNNAYGQLGDGTPLTRAVPVQVSGLSGVIAVAAGRGHSVALKADGTVQAWGDNYYGQLGTGNYTPSSTPVQVPSLAGVIAIAAGNIHSLALKSDGTVWAWGYNYWGNLGDGTRTDRLSPIQVPNLSSVSSIAAGLHTSFALLSSGSVKAWGWDYTGELGRGQFGTYSLSAAPVSNLSGVRAIAAQRALTSDGRLWAWGGNYAGALGDGTVIDRPAPVQMQNVTQAPPNAATELSAAAGEQLAYLTYKPPTSVVTQYVVTPDIWGVTQPPLATGSAGSAFAVKNLTQATTYSFTVAAQNCLGEGPATPRSERVVPTDVQLGEEGFKIEGTELTDRLNLKVNAFNGNLALHASDLRIAGTGLDLSISRSFNNRSTDTSSPWGSKWAASVGNVRLQFLSGGSAMYNAPGGAQLGFAKKDDGTFQTPPGSGATLRFDDAGTPSNATDDRYRLTDDVSSERLSFDATSGKLLEDKDRNANTITYAYAGPSGKLSSITDTQARVTSLSYNAQGRVEHITDPASRVHAYAYDASGNLTTHTDPAGGQNRFVYDASGNLTRITTPAGRRIDLTYDASGRATTLKWPLQSGTPTTTFSYSAAGPTTNKTVLTDANGKTTTYTFDPVGRTTAIKDALGNSTSLSYTSRSNVRSYGSAGGGTTSFGYTSVNALNSVTVPTGAQSAMQYGDANHPKLPTRITDPQGNATSFAYDLAGNLVSQQNALPSENRVELDYNTDGTLAEMADPRGNAASHTYDADGNLTTTTPPAPLGEISATHDAISRVTSVTDGEGQITAFTYDSLDRVTEIAYADATQVTYVYDADGHLAAMTDPAGTTTMTYDAMGHMTSRSVPDDNPATSHEEIVGYAYDKVGNLTRMWTAASAATLCRTDPASCQVLWLDTGYTYNAVNLPVTVNENGQQKASFTYDANYNRTSTAFPNGITQTFAFDTSGRVTRVAALRAGKTLRSFDYTYRRGSTDTALRQTVTEHGVVEDDQAAADAASGTTAYTFGAGHTGDTFHVTQLEMQGTFVFGGKRLGIAVDCTSGNCLRGVRAEKKDVASTDLCSGCLGDNERWLGEDSGTITEVNLHATAVEVDPQDVFGTISPIGSVDITDADWDAGLGTYSTTHSEGFGSQPGAWQATFSLDATVCLGGSCQTGPVTFSIRAGSALWGSGAYTQVEGAKDPEDFLRDRHFTKKTAYYYDALNRLTWASMREWRRNALPAESDDYDFYLGDTYAYDGAGNRTGHARYEWDRERYNATGFPEIDVSEQATYNAANELTKLTSALDYPAYAETTTETFTYDDNGNPTSSSLGAEATYAASGQTTSIRPRAERGVAASFTYRGVGQTERTSQGPVCHAQTCAPATRFLDTRLGLTLEHPTHPTTIQAQGLGSYKAFVRDPHGGLLVQRFRPEGNAAAGQPVVADHAFLTDGVGSVIALADEQGKIVASFAYDPFGQVIVSAGKVSLTPYRFAGAYQDPTGLLKMGERYYDPSLGRFTQQDPVFDPLDPKLWNRYVYVGNDPVNFVDPSGLSWWSDRWNDFCENRWARLATGALSVTDLYFAGVFAAGQAATWYFTKLAGELPRVLGRVAKGLVVATVIATGLEYACRATGHDGPWSNPG